MKKTFELGGSPDVVMMSASHKQTASGFNGIATNTNNIADKRVIGAVDVYVSDFGEVTFVPNRHQQENRVDILEMDKWELSYLRPFETKELSTDFRPDTATLMGDRSGSGGATLPIGGMYDVDEFFLELGIPVLDNLSVEAGYRSAEYSTGAETDSTKLGAYGPSLN